MRHSNVVILLILVGAGLLVTGPALSYTTFSGSNNCDQCHTGFNGYSGITHQLHINTPIACSSCHVSNGDNPVTSTCAVCHDPNLLWNFHLQFAPADQFGMTCSSCHSVTSTEEDTWDAVKSRYREALFSNR